MNPNAPLLHLSSICRHYPNGEDVVYALNNISLTIEHGEFVAVMGASGSGKSTLMNLIGCLDRPTSGTYEICGQDVSTLSQDALATLRRQTFGFVFQRYNLLANASAQENVEIPAIYAGTDWHIRKTRAASLLQDLGMGNRCDHRPSQLSGGQQQRVAVARALMNNPPVILADEPTGALDSHSGAEVMGLLKSLHAQGRTVILITHDEKVAAHAKRIIKIQDGEIISDTRTIASPLDHLALSADRDIQQQPDVIPEIGESIRTALRALRVNIFRTSLTLLGIIIGVAAVVTMMAIGNGSRQKVLDQINALGTNIVAVRPGLAGFRGGGDIVTLTPADAAALSELANIETVVPERNRQKTLRFGNLDYVTTVQGVSPGFPYVRDWPVDEGTFFTSKDMDAITPVIVLGKTVAKTLFPHAENPIGQYVIVQNIPFQVIGIMSAKGAAPWGMDQDDAVFVPLTTGLTRLFGQFHLNSITIRIKDITKLEETEEEITSLLIERHGTKDFHVRNTTSLLETATQMQNTLTILLGAVAAISLLVGGIGVMNIMLVSVTERTREIGIRMATGARRRDIMLQFNTEAALVCTVGGLMGISLGLLAGWIISLFDVTVIFTVFPALIAFTCAVIIGILFGWLPARKAAMLDPVVALSVE